ncbi:MAG: Re/Si-specific NAD(P)(+) transhydrogenase subunit alpha [Methanomassiliicoccales archaeon]
MAVIFIPKEKTSNERRVSIVPESVSRLKKKNVTLIIEKGAGEGAHYPDEEYLAAGAKLAESRQAGLSVADIVTVVQPPAPEDIALMKSGSIVVGFMNPSRNREGILAMREHAITAFALELLPRITRAQSMDVLSSQATVGGYKAVLLAADHSPRLLPMLTTAAGTIRPARVLVLGAGVAGLMAIATARRLGAMVEAYDVRKAAGEQVRSLGAKFLELQIDAEGSGGYARELTPEEKEKEQAMVNEAVAQADVVITTANVPGRKAPLLVRKEMVDKMKPGAVIVDLAAESGGNCELTKAGENVKYKDVTIMGPLNLPGEVAYHASQMYSRNIFAFLELLLNNEGVVSSDFSDEILAATLLTSAGEIKHQPTREALEVKH